MGLSTLPSFMTESTLSLAYTYIVSVAHDLTLISQAINNKYHLESLQSLKCLSSCMDFHFYHSITEYYFSCIVINRIPELSWHTFNKTLNKLIKYCEKSSGDLREYFQYCQVSICSHFKY